jgi:glycosyltransferase involved in cell wall biosynthesis
VLHVIPSYPPTTTYTGPPASLHRLCRELQTLGVDVRVATTNDNGRAPLNVPVDTWITHDDVPVFYGHRHGRRGDLSTPLHRCIQREAPDADLVHVAPVFSWPTLSAARACRVARRPLIVSPRGSLAPQALQWRSWKKALFMELGGRTALRAVAAFHATTSVEAGDIRILYPEASVEVVPNGVDLPSKAQLSRTSGNGKPIVLYLGRLHPHKNVDVLIASWALVADRLRDATLVLAGAGTDQFTTELRRLAERSGVAQRVEFAGHVEGDRKTELLASARVLVLPSKSENFGNAVAESLAYGTPVIASTGTPWKEVTTYGCGWWVEANAPSLATAIETACGLDVREAQRMGVAGREWMARDFGWTAVARRMKDFYGNVIARGFCAN